MKKIVIVPDSFKGTLSAQEICQIVEDRIKTHFPQCQTVSIPVADGGEGSVDCFLTALGGEKITVLTKGPFMENMEASYGLIHHGETAVIEVAACVGLPLVEGCKNPLTATTYGLGALFLDAVKRKVKRIIVGLGGSCTNDGACGLAAAVGVVFRDQNGVELLPTGGTLHQIASIDMGGLNPALRNIKAIAMCDIDNPMYGENGAATIFAPQKGASPDEVKTLDLNLVHLDQVIKSDLGLSLAQIPGSGAAGAMGAGMIAFFGAKLQMGIDTVLDTVGFDQIITDADLIISGEGKMDSQSLRGKVVMGVAARAKQQNKPLLVLAGGIGENIEVAYDLGVSSVFSINRLPEDFAISRLKSRENLAFTTDNLMRFIKTMEKNQ